MSHGVDPKDGILGQNIYASMWHAKLFQEHTQNVTVFEEVGIELQKTAELYAREVDNDMQNTPDHRTPDHPAFSV